MTTIFPFRWQKKVQVLQIKKTWHKLPHFQGLIRLNYILTCRRGNIFRVLTRLLTGKTWNPCLIIRNGVTLPAPNVPPPVLVHIQLPNQWVSGYGGRGVHLTTYLHDVPMLRMTTAISLFPTCDFMGSVAIVYHFLCFVDCASQFNSCK